MASIAGKLGIALALCQGEAIAGVIVIGYSVDYVVHLAHMYCEGKHFGHNTRRWIADNRRWIMMINDAHSCTSTVICTMEPTF